MSNFEKKYVEQILEAVEYHAVVPGDSKIRQIINKIYEDGFADGVADYECEEPVNYREMMQDLD